MLRPSDSEDEPCNSVLNRLQALDEVGSHAWSNKLSADSGIVC